MMRRIKRLARRTRDRRLLAESLESRRLLAGPYAPAADQDGSTAVFKDDPGIVGWATGAIGYVPGAEVDPMFQTPVRALGPAEGTAGDVVSLGRGGTITLTFDAPIRDGLGFDFAVFENALNDTFLELAHVEVSSDGDNYFRFPSDSLTPGPVDAFGAVDPTNVHNLAGKYRQGFGTPFDLEDMLDVSPFLDVTRVTHVRMVDVVGDGSQQDASGDPIYDPFPTVGSSGFDLDAVAVLHQLDASREVVGFEDVGANLLPGSAFSGPDPSGTQFVGEFDEVVTVGTFQSGTLTFNNAHSQFEGFSTWAQWAYSNANDTVTPGFGNQFSSYEGGGAEDSATFGLGFVDQGDSFDPPTITRSAGDTRRFESLLVTNSTYAALSMLLGDSFAKKFGGPSGTDDDFFLLTATGKDADAATIGMVEFYLADYRFPGDNELDYIVDQWLEVDLSPIADAHTIEFTLSSSDVGAFGMNTPAYFAVDNIVLSQEVLPIDIADRVVLETDGDNATIVRISRPDNDTSDAIEITIEPIDPNIASAPTSVTIPAGERYVEFPVAVVDNDLYHGDREITIEASAAGFIDNLGRLTVSDDELRSLSLSLQVSILNEGGSLAATVSRNDADLNGPLTVDLASSDLALVSLNNTVTIESGNSSANFTILGVEDNVSRDATEQNIQASASDYVGDVAFFQVTNNDAPAVKLELASTSYDESDPSPMVTLSRNTLDVSQNLEVTLESSDTSEVTVDRTAIILAGESSVSVSLGIVNDALVDGNQAVDITASADGHDSFQVSLTVADDDVPQLSLTILTPSIDEPEGQGRAVVRRNLEDTSAATPITLSADIAEQLVLPNSLEIPVDASSAEFVFTAKDNDVVDGDRSVLVTASAIGFQAGSAPVEIKDEDVPPPTLTLTLDRLALSESEAPPSVQFEGQGRRLLPESFYNGSDQAGGFVSDGVEFNNDFDPLYGSWAGWSFSNTTDTTTPGFTNQYSAFTGGGAHGSDTYAVATVSLFPQPFLPTITRDPATTGGFQTIEITNSTYAALSMMQGDAFAKRFGGESGDDPDYFMLTIEGRDENSDSLGTVEFFLADYRFADNSLDYIIDQWVTVDVSSLADAVQLEFSLSSSDVGDFGMNTPAYFAIDNILLDGGAPQVATGTVTRSDEDLSEPLQIELHVDDVSEARVPSSVLIPRDAASVTFEIHAVDDAIADGSKPVQMTAMASDHVSSSASLSVEDDEVPTLTFSLSLTKINESAGSGATQLVIHRNTEDRADPLPVSLSDPGSDVELPASATLGAGDQSAGVDIDAVDNVVLEADRSLQILGSAAGFFSIPVSLTVEDNEVAGLIVHESDGVTTVNEFIGSDQIGVSLQARPLSDVMIDVHWDSQSIHANTERLIFAPEQWDQPQWITVNGVPDLAIDPESLTVTFAVDSTTSAPLFQQAEDANVEVIVQDYQPATIRVGEDNESTFLVDDDTDVRIQSVPHSDGLNVLANPLPQTIVIDNLTRSQGPLTVDASGGLDRVELHGSVFSSIAGGEGEDHFVLKLDTPVNLVDLLENRVSGFEQYVIDNQAGAAVTIDADRLSSIVNSEGELTVRLAPEQDLRFVGMTSMDEPVMVGSDFAQVVGSGDNQVQVISPLPWQNVLNRWDVNGDGEITSVDALIGINKLAQVTDSVLPPITALDQFDGYFFDVNGDGEITAADPLNVINEMEFRRAGLEAELTDSTPSISAGLVDEGSSDAAESKPWQGVPEIDSASKKIASFARRVDEAIAELYADEPATVDELETDGESDSNRPLLQAMRTS